MKTFKDEGLIKAKEMKEGLMHREQVKDRKQKISIFDLPLRAPYTLNIYDRDYLIRAYHVYKANMYAK